MRNLYYPNRSADINSRYTVEYSAGVEEINARTLDNRSRPENEAQKEKKRYDLRKSANIKMYNRQLNTVRSAITSADKGHRGCSG
ncbi:MAG: hypothetical protein V1854_00980 [Methanobacteriota archaeon]